MLILLPLQGHGETGVIKQLNLLHLMKVVLIGFVGDTKFSDSQSAVTAGLNASNCIQMSLSFRLSVRAVFDQAL